MNDTTGAAAGWAFPGGARKAHYFPAGEYRSICSRWFFVNGRREPDTAPSPDDCVKCRAELTKRAGRVS